MNDQRMKPKTLVSLFFLAMLSVAITCLTGCQIDLTGGFSTKALYPDKIQGKEWGDPRKPMYAGSGYTERAAAGRETGFTGFKPLPRD